ncbi:MAG: 16S rRNA (adenine(1518)-N(6)/adenine(1519)-N(6))-dimethyltransferase RsmA [Bacteroidales bacterium]|jgi:16S rRNA (adenine1518-N6/adenine1519-N6)-dimethyltransferase|nr:16S rRNA (adenine(1518)-N(6)/adenine(1519)-N(6))-dimethyltransferase RsmA [Bacteroidales bacterium]MCU0409189.1 16S rRNA (adenine(1518)-N(6)/adenine(1519)-N(6))-dimethyltransferase RsmA [Bacteroidales bacterium]
MNYVRAKKSLGQHFLKDRSIAQRIAGALSGTGYDSVLEVGPGMGILTSCLLERGFSDLRAVEIDRESVEYLRKHMPSDLRIIEGDFLTLPPEVLFPGRMAVIGNFPYNISSQIFFRILEHRDKVAEVAGMLQKEVAERICAGPGSRTYGILSVLLQAYYKTEYLFTVSENSFIPPPKVKSGVLRLTRNSVVTFGCDEQLFRRVVKTAFNQRRKTLRNSLKAAFGAVNQEMPYAGLRPEQLDVDRFRELTNWISENMARSE